MSARWPCVDEPSDGEWKYTLLRTTEHAAFRFSTRFIAVCKSNRRYGLRRTYLRSVGAAELSASRSRTAERAPFLAVGKLRVKRGAV